MPDPLSQLESEHGLSLYFEVDGKRWLMDVGSSPMFLRNARKMGIDIAAVDFLILSHAHADHTGGLRAFLEENSKATVLLSSHIEGAHYYSTRRGSKRDISIDYQLIKEHRSRFMFVCEDWAPSPSLRLFTILPHRYPAPAANATLMADDSADDFRHELAVEIHHGGEGILLSSCSHAGILNTLAAASDRIKAYIGGLHLVDSDAEHQFETDEELERMASTLRTDYPSLKIYTGHCTGAHAVSILRTALLPRFDTFFTGATLRIE